MKKDFVHWIRAKNINHNHFIFPLFQLKCSNYAFYMDIETVTILFMA